MLKLTNNTGIYVLELKVKNKFTFSHHKLGVKDLVKGYYYYFGSAQINLSQRINRHLNKNKKEHWHIDFLTCNDNILINKIFIIKNLNKDYECKIANGLKQSFNLKIPIKNFGNSDCNKCESHLLFSKIEIDYNHLCSLYQSTVLCIPSSNKIC